MFAFTRSTSHTYITRSLHTLNFKLSPSHVHLHMITFTRSLSYSHLYTSTFTCSPSHVHFHTLIFTRPPSHPHLHTLTFILSPLHVHLNMLTSTHIISTHSPQYVHFHASPTGRQPEWSGGRNRRQLHRSVDLRWWTGQLPAQHLRELRCARWLLLRLRGQRHPDHRPIPPDAQDPLARGRDGG